MDFLQIALILLIILLGVFLSVTGVQVFFILSDLKKALQKLNEVIYSDEEIVEKVKQSIKKPSPKRFFKKAS